MRIQDKITSELDGGLAKHNVKLDQYEDVMVAKTAQLDDAEAVDLHEEEEMAD